jgi:RNA polymerase sigma-70 factor (ECF subfamily)
MFGTGNFDGVTRISVQGVALGGRSVEAIMSADRDDHRSSDDSQATFLRLFLSTEKELFRCVAALVPCIADAEEIVQQAAVTLWSKFDQYDRSQPFTPWACRFAINIAHQWVARRQRWQSLLDRGLAEELTRRREELRPQFETRLRHLDGCLEKLAPEQRAIVEAYYFRRKDVAVIAAESQRSVDAVYKLLQRIRSLLRHCIEGATQTGEPLS